jgi:hypothetical protein
MWTCQSLFEHNIRCYVMDTAFGTIRHPLLQLAFVAATLCIILKIHHFCFQTGIAESQYVLIIKQRNFGLKSFIKLCWLLPFYSQIGEQIGIYFPRIILLIWRILVNGRFEILIILKHRYKPEEQRDPLELGLLCVIIAVFIKYRFVRNCTCWSFSVFKS